jgi:3-oxoacyl-[acyl-carrier protein] reductase
MLLINKTAVVYGGAGSVGAAVARAFAKEGEMVFLAERTAATLRETAKRINDAGAPLNLQ